MKNRNPHGFRHHLNLFIILIIILTGFIPTIILSSNEKTFADDTNQNSVEVRFLNSQLNPAYSIDQKGNEANIIKTLDNKYVLIDTGNKNERIQKLIKDTLSEYQNGKKGGSVVIDYLIVSHLDGDHYGNAAAIIQDKDVKVKNVAIKYEGRLIPYQPSRKTAYDSIISAAKAEKANIYTNATKYKVDGEAIQNYANYKKMNAEGTGNAEISVGKYLKLYFYNTRDVYSDVANCDNAYVLNFIRYTGQFNESNFLKDSDGYYLRLNNSSGNYPNIKYEKTKKLEKSAEYTFNTFYYATMKKNGEWRESNTCLSNGNSYVVLAEVRTNTSSKYIYFANDIDNYGYDLLPTKEKVVYYSAKQNKEVTLKNHEVYGNSYRRFTTHNADEIYGYKGFDGVTFKKGTSNKVYSETRAALEVADRLGSDLNNIVIYQASHHGGNSAPDAIKALNLNRAGVYVVANRRGVTTNAANFSTTRFYYYDFTFDGNGPKYFKTSQNQGNGVFCAISKAGVTKCSYKEIKTNTLSYNLNGGTGSFPAQSCIGVSGCKIKIPDAKPIRNGYNFLGWAKEASSTSGIYQSNKKILIAENTTLYAIWAPIYTLSYDANGGNNAPTSQTCSPKTADGNCKLTIADANPTRTSHIFLGWGTKPDATSASYQAGKTIKLKSNTTLYAIWKQVINVNTSVNGEGGTISSSLTNIQVGQEFTITFKPKSGYEIDNVKVNNSIVAISNNKLTLTASTEDLNIVVTYKLMDIPPEPEIYNTYSVYFSSNNGGTGFPETVQCTTSSENSTTCQITIPSSIPTRDGYVFLGYNASTDLNHATYLPGNTYNISQDLYLLGVWAPIYTLSYNINGGEGSFAPQTCHPENSISDSCSVNLSSEQPTLTGKEFFGWSTSEYAESPDYSPGASFTFTPGVYNETLYAVWSKGEVEWQQAQDYVINSDVDSIVEISYPSEALESVEIDGNKVEESNYEVNSEDTVISIPSQFMDTLPTGSHTLTAHYSSGVSISTTFSVSPAGESEDIVADETCATNPNAEGCQELPNTGPAEIIMAVVIVSCIGFIGYRFYRTNQTLSKVENFVSGRKFKSTKSHKKNHK
ncbi:InlB B-repeat-containing protein [Candidatus Saccharibacteria bacterium]|nr:InlB B-repeat-containing protein [Candidatus Saccharibacteria bacterium]